MNVLCKRPITSQASPQLHHTHNTKEELRQRQPVYNYNGQIGIHNHLELFIHKYVT
jgi:hypothetical protein